MASCEGEEAQVTKAKIMMWAEFTYKIAIGELDRGVELRKIGISGMETLFKNRGWTAQQLFTRGDPTYRGEQNFRNFAFGSLLHLVEDSFSLSHTERDEPSGAKCDAEIAVWDEQRARSKTNDAVTPRHPREGSDVCPHGK
jgi:hypothetical protein